MYPPFILNTMDKQNDFIFTHGKFRNLIFFSKLYMYISISLSQILLGCQLRVFPFCFCQISPHYCQAQVHLAVNEKIHYYFFFLQISKNIQIKITNTKNTILEEKLFITFFSQKKNSYFLTITNSIHKIYT